MCNCETLHEKFTVRNDGKPPLANDTKTTVTLPAGTISDAGLAAIRDYLLLYRSTSVIDRDAQHKYYSLAYTQEVVGGRVQDKTGNYAKRLSRHAYQVHALKLPTEVLSQVGCLAADHSQGIEVQVEVTRELNRRASYFYHTGSCWWTADYGYSRCTLKTNGGFAMRSFDQYNDVSGRAWVMPLRLNTFDALSPTFDTVNPAAFMVFNGYGDLECYTPARVLAHMTGLTYRKIGFTCELMYINAGGYLVAPEELAEHYTDGSLDLNLLRHSSLFYDEQHEAALALNAELTWDDVSDGKLAV